MSVSVNIENVPIVYINGIKHMNCISVLNMLSILVKYKLFISNVLSVQKQTITNVLKIIHQTYHG